MLAVTMGSVTMRLVAMWATSKLSIFWWTYAFSKIVLCKFTNKSFKTTGLKQATDIRHVVIPTYLNACVSKISFFCFRSIDYNYAVANIDRFRTIVLLTLSIGRAKFRSHQFLFYTMHILFLFIVVEIFLQS